MSRWITIPILALAGLATAYDGKGEDVRVGDGAPWGIPTDVFQQAVSQPNATGLFTIPGYDLSSPADKSMEKTREWTINISVRGDVPLDEASVDSPDGEDKEDLATTVTSFRISAPDAGVINEKKDVNTFCAAVGFGFNSPTTRKGQSDAEEDGECGFLSQECRDGLVEASRDAGSSCDKVDVPVACEDYFNDSVGMESFEMTAELLGASRFFSFGSQPAMDQNDTEYDIAVTNIWPVLFSWHHQDGQGEEESTATLRCMRAATVAFDSREPGDVPDRGDEGEGDAVEEEAPAGEEGGEGEEGAASGVVARVGVAAFVVVGLSSLLATL